jgi:hypothetical protein
MIQTLCIFGDDKVRDFSVIGLLPQEINDALKTEKQCMCCVRESTDTGIILIVYAFRAFRGCAAFSA